MSILERDSSTVAGEPWMQCSPAAVKLLWSTALTMILIIGCAYGTTLPDVPSQVAGWFGLLFFGAAWALLAFFHFRYRPTVIIDDEGIVDRRLCAVPIRWTDIEVVYPARIYSTQFVCIDVLDEHWYEQHLKAPRRVMHRASRWLRLPMLAISMQGLDGDVDAVLACIARGHPELVEFEVVDL